MSLYRLGNRFTLPLISFVTFFVVLVTYWNFMKEIFKFDGIDDNKPLCFWNKSLGLPIHVNKTVPSNFFELESVLSFVQDGGFWQPSSCQFQSSVAVIIPYRNREKNLKVFLNHFHPFLRKQNLKYRIFIIDQNDTFPFNRAKLMNVGFLESQKLDDFNCFIFHDVDLLSEDNRNYYGCPSSPRHMCPAVDKFAYQLFSDRLFGGVVGFNNEHFRAVNGFSNKYWGWGSEDDDMYWRLRHAHIKFSRPSMEHGRYTMLGHDKQIANGKAMNILLQMEKGELNFKNDGLTTLKYQVLDRIMEKLYTHIKVDLLMTKQEKDLTTVKSREN